MTGEQYVRANKRVYNVVMILLAVMTILSVMACLAEFKITILLQAAAAVAGIIVVNTYAKKFWDSKKGGEILLGTGSAVYCVFLLLNQNNFVYAYGIPLFVACVLYLDVKFVYYGIGVTAVGNIIHIIVQVITKRADGIELFFSIIILATVVYAVGQLMDQCVITVECKNDRFVFGKECIVFCIAESVRMFRVRL